MSEQPPRRPPEMVAASDQPVRLVGDAVSVSAAVAQSTDELLRTAVDAGVGQRIYVNVEDIKAAANPGVVYGVYLNRPATAAGAEGERYHIGNLSLFGIEKMNDPDEPHEGVPGLRHTFDVTDQVSGLRDRGEWDPALVTVTFEPLAPLAPPNLVDESLVDVVAEQRLWAARAPVVVGRVSVFVGEAE